MTVLFIGLAGVLGALVRYGVSLAVDPYADPALFPLATLLCNFSGSFALGWLSGGGALRLGWSERKRIAVTTGFVGSYTTFSTFGAETVHFLDSGHGWMAAVYVMTSLWGGLLLAWAGGRLAEARKSGGEAV
ncbi:fluoride efflux transporter FluC [Paenibacillus sp. GCM10012303]|uniref:fluoride efflux transporter FluC n=1 Tax=Paenibacillus sp. GCM10012303 TaxID=3317340 RepID=UPI00361BEB6E